MFFFKSHFFFIQLRKYKPTKLFIHSFFVFVQTLKPKHADAISSFKHFKTEWRQVFMIGMFFLQLIKEIKSLGNISSVLFNMINGYLLFTYHIFLHKDTVGKQKVENFVATCVYTVYLKIVTGLIFLSTQGPFISFCGIFSTSLLNTVKIFEDRLFTFY